MDTDKAIEIIYKRIQEYNTHFVERMAERIRQIGQIEPERVNRAKIMVEVYKDMAQFENGLKKALRR